MSNAPNSTPIGASDEGEGDEFPPNTKLLLQWETHHVPSLGVDDSLKVENPVESSYALGMYSLESNIERQPTEESNPFHQMAPPSVPMIPEGVNFGGSMVSTNDMLPRSSSLHSHASSSSLPGVEMSMPSDVSIPLGGIVPSIHGLHVPVSNDMETGEIPIENLLDEVHAQMRERMLGISRSATMEDEHVRGMMRPSSSVGTSNRIPHPDLHEDDRFGSPSLFMNDNIQFSSPTLHVGMDESAYIPHPSMQGEHIFVPLSLPMNETGYPTEGIPSMIPGSSHMEESRTSMTVAGEKERSKGKEILGEISPPGNQGFLDLRPTLQAQGYPQDPILHGVHEDVYKFISPDLDGKYVRFGEEGTELEEEKPPKKKRTWSPEEHRLFLEGVEKLGRGNWKEISEQYVTTRTRVQVASHAQRFLANEEEP